jgi:uncharacterized protein (DUF58 family)
VSTDSEGPDRLLWRPRAFLLLGAGAVLAAAAVALRSPAPLFVALPMLFAPFAAAALAPARRVRADVAWRAGGLGAEVAIEGTVHGPFGGSVAGIALDLPTPAGARVSRSLETRGGPEEIRFRVGWTFREPTLTHAEAPQVLWRDPLGLCERRLHGARPDLALERYPPEVHRLGSMRLDRTVALAGETRSRRLGASGEFFGIRAAVPGEPRSRINWRASARAGRLLANDYQVDLTGDVVLLLDTRPTSRDRTTDERLLGIARAGSYGIADALLRTKVRLGLAVFGEFLEAIPLSSGRAHRVQVLSGIAASRLSGVAAPAERCAQSLRRYFRPGVTTLVISAWTDDPTGDLVPYLRRQGFVPLLVSPSPLPLLRGSIDLVEGDERLARRIEALERRERLAENWQHAPVIDWEDYWSLESLVRFLRGPSHRRVA